MKFNFKSMMALAFTALAFTACSDEDEFIPETSTNDSIVLFTAENPGVDPAGTRVSIGEENGIIAPTWDAKDFLRINLKDEKGEDYRVRANGNETGGKTNKFSIAAEDGVKVFGKSGYITSDGISKISSETSIATASRKGMISKKSLNDITAGDMLISKKVSFTEGQPIPVSLKRVTSVVAMNINDATTNNSLKGKVIDVVSIKIANESPIADGTQYEIDLNKGVVSSMVNKTNSEMAINFEEGCNDALMDGAHPFYFSILPFTLSGKGEEIAFDITIKTKDGAVINKVLKFGKNTAIKFEAGKYSTLKFSIKDTDIVKAPAAGDLPTCQNGVITMKKAGTLTSKMVADNMTTKGITIIGNINATDIQAIKNVMNGKEKCGVTTENGRYDLNLADANIVAGGTPFKTHFQFQPNWDTEQGVSITKDNTLPKCFIDNIDTKVGNIILPKSLTTLDAYAIWINERVENVEGNSKLYSRQVTLNGNITTINGPWVRMYNWPTIYFAINPPAQQKGDWNSGFNGLVNGQCNIIVYRLWKQHMIDNKIGENGIFFNKTFHSVRLVNHETDKDYFVENIYNAIDYERTQGGSGLIDLRQSGILTAWMINKAMNNNRVKIVGNMGGSDISGLKTFLRGETGYKAVTDIDLSEVVFVNDNSLYEGAMDFTSKGGIVEYTMLPALPNTLNQTFLDYRDIYIRNITLPANLTVIKHCAIDRPEFPNGFNDMRQVVIGRNITTTENMIVTGSKWHVVFNTPLSTTKSIDGKTFYSLKEGKLSINKSWKGHIPEGNWGGKFKSITYIN